jgi:DnaJ-class molecular chaperone with C-terminal Zn finger domain
MALIEYYTLLGVNRGAGLAEIKKAYRRLAVHWHPDRNPGSRLAEEKFKAIAEAYAVLSNPAKRRQYDRLGPIEFKNEFSHQDIFQGFEPGDFFKLFGQAEAKDELGRIFSAQNSTASPAKKEDVQEKMNVFFAGFGQKNSARGNRAQDILVPLIVSFKEAALGAEKFVAYNNSEGAVKLPVSVPAGAAAGQKIIIKGRGPAKAGSQPGDVIVTLTITPDPKFSRRGPDLLTSLELSPKELAEGCRPLLNALDGRPLRLTIPAGTAAGATFKLAGYGLPKTDGGQGDLLVQIKRTGQ